MVTITTFGRVPGFARGLVRDLRVRWALEEAGIPYRTTFVDNDGRNAPGYRARQPFGQVPVYEHDGLVLFESGAIVLHVAQQGEALLPADPAARARAITWMFAALNSIEPPIMQLAQVDIFCRDEAWAPLRRPGAVQAVQRRLADLAAWLGGREYLEGSFTAGDLLMTTVLRVLRHTPLLDEQPTLAAYKERCEARPAFQRALAAQLADLGEPAAA